MSKDDGRHATPASDEAPKCCYGWAMKPQCVETCPHATEEAKKLLMHRLSYPASVAQSESAPTIAAIDEPMLDGSVRRWTFADFKAAQADAARYRWLRSEEVATDPAYYGFWQEFDYKLTRDGKMDALIDKWMGK